MFPFKRATRFGNVNVKIKAILIFTFCINVVKLNSVLALYFSGLPPTYLQSVQFIEYFYKDTVLHFHSC